MSLYKKIAILSAVVLLISCSQEAPLSTNEAAIDAVSFDADINEIISGLSLEEKVGQMTNLTLQTIASEDENRQLILDPEKLHDVFVTHHVGSIQNVISGAYEIEQWHSLVQQLQDYTLTKTRHKIPFLYSIDAVHGANYILGGTQFPHNLSLAATRNINLVRKTAAITAAETRAAGIRQNYSPVLDVGRNQLWSRLGETFGEDTYIVTQMGKAAIQGFEGSSQIDSPTVASTIKHFVGYSDPQNGKDRAPAYIPEIILREYYLPQFQEAVNLGAKTVMVNSGEVNGVPLHASQYLLTDVLRGELGFQGVIISDWQDLLKMHERHRVADSHKEAVYLAVNAGIDMVIVPYDFSFSDDLIALVKEGRISEERIDAAVGRILTLKKSVGLFDTPNVEEDLKQYFGKAEYQQTALEAARESLILLKNQHNILPLKLDTKVLLTGPTAKHASSLHGAWSYSWQGNKEDLYPENIKSVKNAFSEATYIKSLEFDSEAEEYSKQLLDSAKDHDVILLALGEETYAETPGNIPDLAMPQDQIELVKLLATSGKPIIVLLLEGRPRIIREIEPLIDGLIVGFWPGSRGAEAFYDVVYGRYSPSGKLPITYPRYSGTLLTYDHKWLDEGDEKEASGFSYIFDPQYQFGEGLSYTTFKYSHLTVDTNDSDTDIKVGITVENNGQVTGQEVVELYTRDWYASITPSVKRLRRFEKISLEPGESKSLTFTLSKKDVSFVNAEFETIFEPGDFDVIIGSETQSFDWQ
ncbi:MAG: glycoside hydrolase family 3 N-terminal domain-containing protein [Pseudomonadales bacterium]